MGQAKIEVFRRILDDEDTAQRANARFERTYTHLLAGGAVRALPGALDALTELRDSGIKICLTTGFAPATRDALLAQLDWQPLIDLALSPTDAGRGHPWPDMIQLAARTLAVADPGDGRRGRRHFPATCRRAGPPAHRSWPGCSPAPEPVPNYSPREPPTCLPESASCPPSSTEITTAHPPGSLTPPHRRS